MKLRKIWFNKRSSKKYGWQPEWFGALDFNEDLIVKVESFQREHDLEVDGLVGSKTYRRAYTQNEENAELLFKSSGIICNGENVPIQWDKIKYNFLPRSCFKKPSWLKKIREPSMVVTHWDACLSADSCRRVLERRGISTHFVIDNDGTILQLVDCNDIAWHAGNKRVNKASIGIDLSNAVYPKYQKWYRRKGFGSRPILGDVEMHGRKLKKPFLGYYPEQLQAYKALIKALHDHYGIPLECLMKDGKLSTDVDSAAKKAKFAGVINHYNISARKWDAAGLEVDKILAEIKKEQA